MDIIERIEHEIERLNDQIINDESFEGRESVNLNGLVCLLRFAAWKNPNELRKWFTRDKKEFKITINPGIVNRFSLSKPSKKGSDGAQLRIHIFENADETAKHNHQRSFITMCIQGSYEYRYYYIDYKNPVDEILFYERLPEERREKDENGKSRPFKYVETKMGDVRRVQYDTWNSEERFVEKEDKQVFDQNFGPLYVSDEWYHTVHTNGSEDEPVITVLIRRQKEKKEDTLFIRTKSDKHFENEPDTHDADEEEIEKMWNQVKNALTKGSAPAPDEHHFSSNAISEFMNPLSSTIRTSEPFLSEDDNYQKLQSFLSLNDFSFCPVTKKEAGVEKFLYCIDEEGNKHFTGKNDTLGPETPIMFGILYTVLSPKFVVPIVDENSQEFHGILSLFDILTNLKRFATSIIKSSLDTNQPNLITRCAELINAVNNLHKIAKENRYELRKIKPEVINDILMPLGDLLLNSNLLNLMISEFDSINEEGPWLSVISKPVFEINDECYSQKLLHELKDICDFDSFAYRHSEQIFETISYNNEKSPIRPIDEKASSDEVLAHISDGNWPLFVENSSKKSIKIVSIDELFSPIGKKMMAEAYSKIIDHDKQLKLYSLILKSYKRYPNFSDEDFENALEIFKHIQ